MRNIAPNMAKKTSVMAALAAVKRRFWKKRTSSIGWLERSSHTTKATITRRPTTSEATTVGCSPSP